MKSPISATLGQAHQTARPWCSSRKRQMPRNYLRVLPASTRPSLFAGD